MTMGDSSPSAATRRIGIIGMGVMGSAIATRLLDRGHSLALRDPAPDRLARFVARGAAVHDSAAALTRAVDVVILSLNTAAIVEQVVFGPGGLREGADAHKLLIDMSSIDPQATAAMAARLAAETGMAWVDAPLSGGAPAALEGRLTLMIGGAADAVARAEPVLAELAANRTHMGPSGAGQTTKLVNQVLCACGFLAVAEATRLALDAGVDAARIPAALAGGRADSRILQEFMPKMAAFDYTPTGRIDNMLKDLEAVQHLSRALRTPMPMTGLVAELHHMLVRADVGGEDSAAYMKLFDFGRGESKRPVR
jgi:2-hydroxy-3-oxopropionate reductase